MAGRVFQWGGLLLCRSGAPLPGGSAREQLAAMIPQANSQAFLAGRPRRSPRDATVTGCPPSRPNVRFRALPAPDLGGGRPLSVRISRHEFYAEGNRQYTLFATRPNPSSAPAARATIRRRPRSRRRRRSAGRRRSRRVVPAGALGSLADAAGDGATPSAAADACGGSRAPAQHPLATAAIGATRATTVPLAFQAPFPRNTLLSQLLDFIGRSGEI